MVGVKVVMAGGGGRRRRRDTESKTRTPHKDVGKIKQIKTAKDVARLLSGFPSMQESQIPDPCNPPKLPRAAWHLNLTPCRFCAPTAGVAEPASQLPHEVS